MASEAARLFSLGSEEGGQSGERVGPLQFERQAIVLKPGAIYGTRYSGNVPIPLGLITPASVENVATAAVEGALGEMSQLGPFVTLGAQRLATYHLR